VRELHEGDDVDLSELGFVGEVVIGIFTVNTKTGVVD